MIQIKILLQNKWLPFLCSQHTAAIITDLSTNRMFPIEYPEYNPGANPLDIYATDKKDHPVQKLFNEHSGFTSCAGVAVLYSDKNFDAFVTEYRDKFGNHDLYDFCAKNCADAVKFSLDYFFPEAKLENCSYTALQIACCVPFVASLGLVCIPAPPNCIVTPRDVFNKATLLSVRYGSPSKAHMDYQELTDMEAPIMQSSMQR